VSSGPTLLAPAISDADFKRFSEFFYQRTGIHFGSGKRYFVDKRLQACITHAGEASFAGWFMAVRLGSQPELMQDLINEFTVNETYFLREDYQFDCLLKSVLPEVVAGRRDGRSADPVRILSLPCSTGEEPYSIALRLLEEWPEIAVTDVSIYAGDIDTTVLDVARRGRYGRRSLQRVPVTWLQRHFTRDGPEHHVVNDEIRSAIDFSVINVCDRGDIGPLGHFDVVFCRNLLIYFDERSSRHATENLYDILRPGGFLFLGHSESMSRISGIFTPRRFADALVYQRPETGDAR